MPPVTLTLGSCLGPYEILSALGAGGMGEVYRARDTRLNREVAIKVLPAHLAADAVSLERFEREARSIAALSHPHILAIFDVGRDELTAYAVTELLDGRTLREQLVDGPMPPRRAIEVARQITNALAAAHVKGIVHRDLKPENIFLTRDGVKILDFGLARQVVTSSGAEAALTMAMTDRGIVMGTAGYMSPEQVRAQEVDHRADIFAFGAVLYEMLSGRRAFSAPSAPEMLTAVLREDPPQLSGSITGVSPAIERLTRRCLEKDPEHRFQSARDLGFALDALGPGLESTSSAARSAGTPATRLTPILIASMAASLVAGALVSRWLSPAPATPTPGPTATFSLDAGFVIAPRVEVSPDGRLIAYTTIAQDGIAGVSGVGTRIMLRRLDALESTELAANAELLDWSADSRYLLVRSEGSLLKFDATTGERTVVGTVDGQLEPARYAGRQVPIIGACWLPDGGALAGTGRGIGRMRRGVPGVASIVAFDASRDEWIGWPSLLPDGVRFLYLALPKGAGATHEVRLGSLDATKASSAQPILQGVTGVRFMLPGNLVFVRGRALYVQRFDPTSAQLSGTAVQVARDVNAISGGASISASRTGVLAYRTEEFPPQSFVWVDRLGRTIQEFSKRDTFSNFDLSPDAQRVAVTARRPGGSNELWLLDLRL